MNTVSSYKAIKSSNQTLNIILTDLLKLTEIQAIALSKVKQLYTPLAQLQHLLEVFKGKVMHTVDSHVFNWLDSFYNKDSVHISYVTSLPIMLFFLSALICLCLSATFHLVYEHSKRINDIFIKLDYAGVNILITGSCIPVIYYGFFCSPYV